MLACPCRFRCRRPGAFAAAAVHDGSSSFRTRQPRGTMFAKRRGLVPDRTRIDTASSIAVSASASDENDNGNEASTSTSSSSNSGNGNKNEDDLWIEQELRRRKNSRSKKKNKEGPTVIAPAVARAKGESSAAPADAAEVAALQFLGAFFFVLLLEGVALAASGFFPENVDAFITERIYPTYSPQLGVFLLCSSAYGLWKSKQQ